MVLQGYLNVPIKKVMRDAVNAREKHQRKLATATCLWNITHYTTLQLQRQHHNSFQHQFFKKTQTIKKFGTIFIT